ncbi:ABC transporter permease [Paenibacillus aceti]|uniref:ABC transporter permease n=1 Tax=Paenibacillus aceti TaxID=1820010 RepID=UPI000EA01A09|nr:ABC-2 family transporter protein [Paenibacillus aceti]
MLKKYWALSRIVLKNNTVYQLDLLARIVTTLVSVFALRQVWTALFTQSASSGTIGMSLDLMLTYATISMILQAFYGPTIVWEISQKIMDGNIVQDFQRPWDFQTSILFRALGKIFAGVITVVIPIAVVTCLFFPIQLPTSIVTWMTFLLSILIGIMINFSLQFFVGLLSFVFVEVWGFEIVLGLVIAFFSGKIIPIAMYPEFLQNLIHLLPFRGLFDIPLSIFVGTVAPAQYLDLLIFQGIWAVILMLIVRVMIRYFQRLLVVAGG